MPDDLGDSASLIEIGGQKITTVELGGVTLTLRPPKLSDLIEFEKKFGSLADMGSRGKQLEESAYLLYLAARRAGDTRSAEEIADLPDADEIELMGEALASVMPKQRQGADSPNVPSPASGPDSSGA